MPADERATQAIADRDFWQAITAGTGWVLYGFTGRYRASFHRRDERLELTAAHVALLKEADRLAREDAARMGDEKREACTVLADLASPCCDHTWHAAQADAFREMSRAIRASITTDEMSIEWDVPTIQREHHSSWVGREMWAIIDLPNGKFGVYWQSATSVGPMTEYDSKRQAVARLLQLIGTGPVAPQTWPESICVGHIERSDEE